VHDVDPSDAYVPSGQGLQLDALKAHAHAHAHAIFISTTTKPLPDLAPTCVEYVELLQGVQYASLHGATTDEYFPAADRPKL
jgi:hypothetical protein